MHPQQQALKQLIKDTPQYVLQGYKSHLQLHLKVIMTSINKSKLQDLSKVQSRRNRCIFECYRKKNLYLKEELSQKNQNDFRDHASLLLEQLTDCKKKCKDQLHAVRKHLDDINFYSKKKFSGCSKKCQNAWENTRTKIIANKDGVDQSNNTSSQKSLNKEYNLCLWDCYNRLDRRYKQYWRQQQNEIIQQFI